MAQPSDDTPRPIPPPPPAPDACADPASALEHVVDDLGPKEQAADWVRTQFALGRTWESVAADLVEGGWPEDTAVQLTETVRRLTRAERGVMTREQVVGGADRYYRRGMGGGWIVGMPSLAAAIRLMYSLGNLLRLRRRRRDER